MNILLCAKQVPDDAVEVSMGADGKPAIDKIDKVVNAFDTYALEMAARFKEAAGEGEITVLCVGPDDAKNGLKNCLAVGGDYAYLASDEAFEGSDMQGIASILKDAIRKIEADKGIAFDIVCTGKEATDMALGQGGILLADKLGTGVITNVIAFDTDENGVSAKQETEEGYRTVAADLPVVLTISKPDYDPRFPKIKAKLAARKKPIEAVAADALSDEGKAAAGESNAKLKILRSYEPPKKESGVKIQEESDEDSALAAVKMMTEAKVL